MRNNMKIILVAIILLIIAVSAVYMLLVPQYKNIEMSGYKLEVPSSDAGVVNVTDNYNTYDDKKNNLTIKTWAWKNVNDSNVDGIYEIEKQYNEAVNSTNVTYDNVSLYNNSNVYTYYEINPDKATAIVITSDNLDQITHIVKSMQKSNITPSEDIANLSLNITNNTTDNQNNTTVTNTKSKKASGSDSNVDSVETKKNYQADDGSSYRQVNYRDGNMRQYDSSGRLIGSTYSSDQAKLKRQAGSDWMGD